MTILARQPRTSSAYMATPNGLVKLQCRARRAGRGQESTGLLHLNGSSQFSVP